MSKYIERELVNPQWQASKNAIHPLEHINCFTDQTLLNLGKSAGLELISQPLLPDCTCSLKISIENILAKFHIVKRTYKSNGTGLYFKVAHR